MAEHRGGRTRLALVWLLALTSLSAACGQQVAETRTADQWVEEVTERLESDDVADDVTDCVLNVARVELERNPLSVAATDELVLNCEAARAVIDGGFEAIDGPDDEPSAGLAMTDQPFTFGDDPTLDALWTTCEEGSGQACDQLFGAAPVGSEYEEFGVSCGHRPELLHCGELDLAP